LYGTIAVVNLDDADLDVDLDLFVFIDLALAFGFVDLDPLLALDTFEAVDCRKELSESNHVVMSLATRVSTKVLTFGFLLWIHRCRLGTVRSILGLFGRLGSIRSCTIVEHSK